MISAEAKREISELNRRRYEQLRAAGQEATPKGLPEATVLNSMPIAQEAVIHSEQVPADWYTTMRLRRGEALRIIDQAGTLKRQWSAAIAKGRVILSDMGRVFVSLVEDTSGAHDTIVGGSTPASTLAAFGVASRNTHENFLAA